MWWEKVRHTIPVTNLLGVRAVRGGLEAMDPSTGEFRYFQDYAFTFGKFAGKRFQRIENPSYLSFFIAKVFRSKLTDLGDEPLPLVLQAANRVLNSAIDYGAMSLHEDRVEWAIQRHQRHPGANVSLFQHSDSEVAKIGTLMALRRLQFDQIIGVGIEVALDPEQGIQVTGLEYLAEDHGISLDNEVEFDIDDLDEIPF